MATVGFVGLGAMGGRIAGRLLGAGHTVIGYNRTAAKAQPLLDRGMQWATSPRQVAERVDVIFTMVAHTAALCELTEGEAGILAGLTPGKVYCDMSTVHPDITRALARRVAATGAQMLDVPVSGGPITVERGELSLMVGGDPAVFARLKPLLLDIGPRVTYIGTHGQATTLKIALNLNVPVQVLAFCESVLLAERSGIPREIALEAILNSAIASPMLKFRGPLLLGSDEVMFNVTMQRKDLDLALSMGRAADVHLPTASLTNQILTTASAMGWAERDFAVIYEVLARLSGNDAA
jgi:3-hydroxyisobutyrate dehydrogenase-like beta-hydroxyacid dehydrogenase